MSCKVNFDVYFIRRTISFAEFSMGAQCIFLLVRSFIDPTFCSIFACGPLQFKCPFTTCNVSATAKLKGELYPLRNEVLITPCHAIYWWRVYIIIA